MAADPRQAALSREMENISRRGLTVGGFFTVLTEGSMQDITVAGSVADQGCLSRILIFTRPGSRISDPGSKNSNTKERGEKKIDVIPFYVATNFTKLYIILVLKC
jgi:hypothetical protein